MRRWLLAVGLLLSGCPEIDSACRCIADERPDPCAEHFDACIHEAQRTFVVDQHRVGLRMAEQNYTDNHNSCTAGWAACIERSE